MNTSLPLGAEETVGGEHDDATLQARNDALPEAADVAVADPGYRQRNSPQDRHLMRAIYDAQDSGTRLPYEVFYLFVDALNYFDATTLPKGSTWRVQERKYMQKKGLKAVADFFDLEKLDEAILTKHVHQKVHKYLPVWYKNTTEPDTITAEDLGTLYDAYMLMFSAKIGTLTLEGFQPQAGHKYTWEYSAKERKSFWLPNPEVAEEEREVEQDEDVDEAAGPSTEPAASGHDQLPPPVERPGSGSQTSSRRKVLLVSMESILGPGNKRRSAAQTPTEDDIAEHQREITELAEQFKQNALEVANAYATRQEDPAIMNGFVAEYNRTTDLLQMNLSRLRVAGQKRWPQRTEQDQAPDQTSNWVREQDQLRIPLLGVTRTRQNTDSHRDQPTPLEARATEQNHSTERVDRNVPVGRGRKKSRKSGGGRGAQQRSQTRTRQPTQWQQQGAGDRNNGPLVQLAGRM